jgi:dihydrofolate synthase/folylpolyglutamate synthase
MFNSPHLEKYNERISLNGKMISDEDLAMEITAVEDVAVEILGPNETLSFFEILTIAAFNYFSKQDIDYAVIEVGLGGRLDCTNVIESPVLSVITSIGFDHMNVLGNTLPEIAGEKAGIIKDGRPIVLYTNPEEVYDVVKKKADEHNAQLYYAKNGINTEIKSRSLNITEFSAECEYFSYDNVKLSLIGNYQIFNASNVLLCVKALRDLGVNLPDDIVLGALAKTQWAGRMEVLSQKPVIIIDGAHNHAGAIGVKETFNDYFKGKRVNLIVGILGDKEYDKMVEELSDIADTVILTEAASDRALPAEDLAKVISDTDKKIIIEKDYKKAFDSAYAMSDAENDIILVAGSLYLLGDLRPYILSEMSKRGDFNA